MRAKGKVNSNLASFLTLIPRGKVALANKPNKVVTPQRKGGR